MRKLCGFKDFGVSSESGHAPVRNVRKMNLEMNLRKIYHPQARRMAFVLVQVSPDSEVVCESCGVGKLLRFRVLRRSPGLLEWFCAGSPGYLESCARKVPDPGDWSRARARFRSLESGVVRAQGSGGESRVPARARFRSLETGVVRAQGSGAWSPESCARKRDRVDRFFGFCGAQRQMGDFFGSWSLSSRYLSRIPESRKKNRVDTFSGKFPGVPSPARGVDTFLGFCGAVRCGAPDE
ncbi:hypothetical protein R1flu_003948 [Riccia fluitans]|uniref:Uncharacterized protein n=1 Tax=Riccia fluitans TaxID=41844 RepID=A0ABD1YRX3_9MARC